MDINVTRSLFISLIKNYFKILVLVKETTEDNFDYSELIIDEDTLQYIFNQFNFIPKF